MTATEAEEKLFRSYWTMVARDRVDMVALADAADELGVPLDRAGELIGEAASKAAQQYFAAVIADGLVTPEEEQGLVDVQRRLGGSTFEPDPLALANLLLGKMRWQEERRVASGLAAHSDLVRMPNGSYRLRTDIEEERASWEDWRAGLAQSGIAGVAGQVIDVVQQIGGEPVGVVAAAVLVGNAEYLDGWCPKFNERRTFRLDRIVEIRTEEGEVFSSAGEWLRHRAAMP